MQANLGDNGPRVGDRLIDWVGVYNLYVLCPATYGEFVSTREFSPHMTDFIHRLAEGDGTFKPADNTAAGFNELAFVFTEDIKFNANPPYEETPAHFNCTVESTTAPPVASFTYACGGLTCNFDGSGSSALDGTITGYAWDFGDGGTGSGVTVSHTYAAAGSYTVVLTVTDDAGATGTDSQVVTASVPAPIMHVGDLDGQSLKLPKSNWKALVAITVHDAGEGLVDGALVSGTWSQGGAVVGSYSCVTGTSGPGRCTIDSGQLPNKQLPATFTVDSMTLGGYTYNAAANHDPDGDSNGTSITVSK